VAGEQERAGATDPFGAAQQLARGGGQRGAGKQGGRLGRSSRETSWTKP
jgi:hypothetical protein